MTYLYCQEKTDGVSWVYNDALPLKNTSSEWASKRASTFSAEPENSGSEKIGKIILLINMFIIRCIFLFLFIDRKPTTWPANNCLNIMVCSWMRNVVLLCLATNNILLMCKWNHAFLLLAIALLWKNGRPHYFLKDIH